MKIKNTFTGQIHDLETKEFDILADDGRSLYSIKLENSVLQISSYIFVKHENNMLDTSLLIQPQSKSSIFIKRDIFDK